jgi:hypothetical protein
MSWALHNPLTRIPLGFQSKILRGFLGPFLKNRVKKLLSGPDQKLINPS